MSLRDFKHFFSVICYTFYVQEEWYLHMETSCHSASSFQNVRKSKTWSFRGGKDWGCLSEFPGS